MNLQTLLSSAVNLPPAQRQRLLENLQKPSAINGVEEARRSFLAFQKRLWPGFLVGRHHPAIANAFERIAAGTLKRLIITMAPRHGKSESSSVFLPAWYLGKFPTQKIICASHTEPLALGFGRRTRNLIRSAEYQEIFPECQIAKDSKAAGRWSTAQGGEYFAVGVGGAVAGRGANLFIIDDPHSEQAILSDGESHFEKVWEWFDSGPLQRLQPGGAIVINMTRWSKRDLVGKLVKRSAENRFSDQWEIISLPAILPSGEPLFPEFWPPAELHRLEKTLPAQRWFANYQQNPVSEETAIVKRAWWKPWHGAAPRLEFTIQSWDTSFGKFKKGDPSACTLWGVFSPKRLRGAPVGAPAYAILLVDCFEAKLSFPELKQKALELWRLHRPDSLVIEGRSAGDPLIDELSRMGLPVSRTAPTCHADKLARLNAVSDLFSAGLVYYLPHPLTASVIEQFAQFPDSEHDDLMDSGVQALARFRAGGFIRMDSDFDEEEDFTPRSPREEYY